MRLGTKRSKSSLVRGCGRKTPRSSLAELFQRICPENITHQTLSWWLAETINLEMSVWLLYS